MINNLNDKEFRSQLYTLLTRISIDDKWLVSFTENVMIDCHEEGLSSLKCFASLFYFVPLLYYFLVKVIHSVKKKKKSQLEKKHKPLEKNMAFDQGQCSNWTGLTFAHPLELTTEQPNASAWIHSLLKVIPRIPERNAFHMISRQQVGTL